MEGGDGSTVRVVMAAPPGARVFFPPGSLGPWVVGGGGVGRTARTVGLGPWVIFPWRLVVVVAAPRGASVGLGLGCAKGAGGRNGYSCLDILVVLRTRF